MQTVTFILEIPNIVEWIKTTVKFTDNEMKTLQTNYFDLSHAERRQLDYTLYKKIQSAVLEQYSFMPEKWYVQEFKIN